MGLLSEAFSVEEDDSAFQATDLDRLFEELPVSLDVFVQDAKFMDSPPLSPIQYELVQHAERVYFPDTYKLLANAPEKDIAEYWSQDIRMVNLLAAEWGKGGGKDHTSRVASMRIAYLLICLRSPQRYFGMPSQDYIHMLNIANEAGQAERAFFRPMKIVSRRGWFADKSDATKNSIIYAKNIEAVSGHSNADSLEGMNLILGVADEIDGFKSKDEMVGVGSRAREASTSAETILDMLKTSASTRFPETYKRIAISFPRYKGSTIQQLVKEAEDDVKEYGEDSVYFASGPWATWESNPTKNRSQYDKDYRKDPIAAAAKYECKPHRATSPYYRNFEIFDFSVCREEQPLTVSYKLRESIAKETGVKVKTWEPEFHFAGDLKPVQGARYAMHADLALTGDRAGISMSHISKWEERAEEVEQEDGELVEEVVMVPHVKNDFTIAFESDMKAKPAREIQIRWARELCYQLRKMGFPVVYFTFDGFQSADSMQLLEREGIDTDKVSTDRDPSLWKSLGDVASEQRLQLPHSTILFEELEALSRVDKGKVDHPPGGSKDLADALAGSVAGAIVAGGEEDPDGDTVTLGDDLFFSGRDAVDDPIVDSLQWNDLQDYSAPIYGWIGDYSG